MKTHANPSVIQASWLKFFMLLFTAFLVTGCSDTRDASLVAPGAPAGAELPAQAQAPWTGFALQRSLDMPQVTAVELEVQNRNIAVTWTGTGSGITDYRVQWNRADEAWSTWRDHGGTAFPTGTNYTIENLTFGDWKIRVRARANRRKGPWSGESVASISDDDVPTTAVPPGRVTGLTVTGGDAQLTLSWDDVSGATSYKVQWKSGSQTFADAPSEGRERVIAGGADQYVEHITGLVNTTEYVVRVIATNAAGDGEPSDEQSAKAGPQRVLRPGKVTGLTVTEGDTQLALSWDAVSGSTAYKVQWHDDSETQSFADAASDGRQHVIFGEANTSDTITGLTNHDQYMVRVIATNAAGDGEPSDEQIGKPDASPVAIGGSPSMTLDVGDSATFDASSSFSDPDGDELTYRAASSDTMIVTAAVSGSVVSLVAVAEGQATVTMTATSRGRSALQELTVTVRRQNRSPEAAHRLPGFGLGPEMIIPTIAPSSYFSDPDGDQLSFGVASSDTAVVTAHMVTANTGENILCLTGVGLGEATVAVTATDPGGLSTTQNMSVQVYPVAGPPAQFPVCLGS